MFGWILTLPFVGNDNGEKDGAVEDDAVDRVEKLREEDGIELTVIGERPLEFCNRKHVAKLHKRSGIQYNCPYLLPRHSQGWQ